MVVRMTILASAGLAALWAGPAAAQLRVSVDNPERCETATQQLVNRAYYYRKLEIEQRFFNRVRREVSRNAVYSQAISDLDRSMRGQAEALARQCLRARPSKGRPWSYEYRL